MKLRGRGSINNGIDLFVVKAVTSLLMASLLMAEVHEEGHHTAEINMLLVVISCSTLSRDVPTLNIK